MKTGKFVVYTEIHENRTVERWYYGTYDYERANQVAIELGIEPHHIYHCVCAKNEARALKVLNLPDNFD